MSLQLDTTAADSFIADANNLYMQMQRLGLEIEAGTGGQKLAKDKAKQLTL